MGIQADRTAAHPLDPAGSIHDDEWCYDADVLRQTRVDAGGGDGTRGEAPGADAVQAGPPGAISSPEHVDTHTP